VLANRFLDPYSNTDVSRICLPEEAELSRKMSVAFVIPTTAISAATTARIMPERERKAFKERKGI
jgi:hypothetical protein